MLQRVGHDLVTEQQGLGWGWEGDEVVFLLEKIKSSKIRLC